MSEPKPVNPTELDAVQAAKKIAEAGIADETAAYVNGDDQETAAEADPAAHPS